MKRKLIFQSLAIWLFISVVPFVMYYVFYVWGKVPESTAIGSILFYELIAILYILLELRPMPVKSIREIKGILYTLDKEELQILITHINSMKYYDWDTLSPDEQVMRAEAESLAKRINGINDTIQNHSEDYHVCEIRTMKTQAYAMVLYHTILTTRMMMKGMLKE